jgi:hypothetical protein
MQRSVATPFATPESLAYRRMTQGERLKRAIRLREFTSMADFARACDVGTGTLRAQIHRDSIPPDAADTYARKLRVPVEWLLYGKGKDPFEGKAAEPRSYTPPGYGTLQNETAIALEVAETVTKLVGLDLTRERQGQLVEDALDLVRKYKG